MTYRPDPDLNDPPCSILIPFEARFIFVPDWVPALIFISTMPSRVSTSIEPPSAAYAVTHHEAKGEGVRGGGGGLQVLSRVKAAGRV